MQILNQKQPFRTALTGWFKQARRPLPWRSTSSWYPVFLSEFLLQQTQVEQALPYYQRFIRRFPSIYDLAVAQEEEVLSLWTGLGYYARARNMLRAAREIVARHDGRFPSDPEEALSLPGIGPYTAAAILSISFGKPLPVVDGNVIRVISRLLALEEDVRLTFVKKRITETSGMLIDPEQPGVYNEAVMELGALICKPTKPDCTNCPVVKFCLARKKSIQERIPFKSAASSKKTRKQLVFAVKRNGQILLVKRPGRGLLASMWELPSVESSRLHLTHADMEQHLKNSYGISGRVLRVSEPMKHTYSHFRLDYRPVLVESEGGELKLNEYVEARWEDPGSFKRIPLHRAHEKIVSWICRLEIEAQ